MRISSGCVIAGTLLAFAIVGTGGLSAKTVKHYQSAVDAYQVGMSEIRKGRIKAAIPALEYAADRKILVAQLQLARIYAAGKLLPKDKARAFHYYQDLADRLAETNPYHEFTEIAAEAFVAIAGYYNTGLPELLLRPNYREAARLYHHAATLFRDPIAQYKLAGMYLAGRGVAKNTKTAAQWLLNAAKKGHSQSQTMLGLILWTGQGGVKKDPSQGLALLYLATKSAFKTDRAKFEGDYHKALNKASKTIRRRAGRIVRQWKRRYGGGGSDFGDAVATVGGDAADDGGPRKKGKDSGMLADRGKKADDDNGSSGSDRVGVGYQGLTSSGKRGKPGSTFSDDGSGSVFDDKSGAEFMGTSTLPVGAVNLR